MAKKRLLLIEDDYDVAEMLLMYFESQGYEALHSDTGEAGIEVARRSFPGLILLDVMLPDMDGYDICLRLRQTALTKYIPILFLTQKDGRASKVRGLQLGADDYITKPFDIDELRLRVEGSIRRATRENLHEPRTGLPTGSLVQEELDTRRAAGFQVLQLALKGFDAYADVYSFIAANDVLYHAGQTIRDVLAEFGTPDDFVGILEDEFIVATHGSTSAVLQAIQERFQAKVPAFYNYRDADQGGITLHAGTERECFVPLMTLEPAEVRSR